MNVYEVTFIDWLGSDIENKYLHADILHFFHLAAFFIIETCNVCVAVPQSSAIIKNAYSCTFSTSPYVFLA